jgi:hypothetical protein
MGQRVEEGWEWMCAIGSGLEKQTISSAAKAGQESLAECRS